jgi:hypothetical protein
MYALPMQPRPSMSADRSMTSTVARRHLRSP